MKKILLVGLVLVAVNALSRAGSGGRAVETLAMWTAFAYLLFRAWPAVRQDLRKLPGLSAGRSDKGHF